LKVMDGASTTGETFTRTTSTGGSQTLHKISGKAIPVEDTNSIFTATDVENVLVEIIRGTMVPGIFSRPTFTITDDDTVTIGAGFHHHQGTTEQICYWDAALAYDPVSLGTDDWSFIYLDDSAIVTAASPVITTTQLIDSTTAPTWSATKHGWYNSSDKCIGMVYADADGDLLEWFHDGGDFVMYAARQADRASAAIGTSWTDVTLTIPDICTRAKVQFQGSYAASTDTMRWRTNGQTDTTGHIACIVASTSVYCVNQMTVTTDTSQKIEVVNNYGNGGQIAVSTDGFYFPVGM
jgi:hypothetical protein